MADQVSSEHNAPDESRRERVSIFHAQITFSELRRLLVCHAGLFWGVISVCFLASLAFAVLSPRLYEASARVMVRTSPASSFSLEGRNPTSESGISPALQQETLAGALRSDQLAWRVILSQKLYQDPAFITWGHTLYSCTEKGCATPEVQAELLERFFWRLNVQSLPHTLLVEMNFRSRDPLLSARVVEAMLQAYAEQEANSHQEIVLRATGRLQEQLQKVKVQLDQRQGKLNDYQQAHGILSAPQGVADYRSIENQHLPVYLEVDELSRQLANATAERLMREADYRAAQKGDPELVHASNPRSEADPADLSVTLLKQIEARRSELEMQQAQLKADYGLNYPPLLQIDSQLRDLARQKQSEDSKLLERFRLTWQTAVEREEMMRRALLERTYAGIAISRDAATYMVMRQEVDANRALYLRLLTQADAAALSAFVHLPDLAIVDPPHPPARAVSPNLVLDLFVGLFAGFWLALGSVFAAERIKLARVAAFLLLLALSISASQRAFAQAPTPSTSGLPTGVARIPFTQERKEIPSAKEAPAVWGEAPGAEADLPTNGATAQKLSLAPISPGDLLEIREYKTPEFHTQVHVSASGTAVLPMLGEIALAGLDDQAAARKIEAALVAKSVMLRPYITVLVVRSAEQDVTMLGEVVRPGIYPYAAHHRLLDLISAASGLKTTAGRQVNITRRSDPEKNLQVLLDPAGLDAGASHNPELMPGDTVQVIKAGLIYVIGDVVRPGGFTVDPGLQLTVAQALTMAWGTTQNADTRRAILIREQNGGRVLTTLNLKRILRGQDPDQPVMERDILFVPNSTARTLLNRTLESAVQSLIGVSIYSGLVYSQRY